MSWAHQSGYIRDFPRAMIMKTPEFSFSLKSAHQSSPQMLSKGESLSTDLCASFQAAVMDILMAKTKKALDKYPVKTLVAGGGQ